MWTNNSIQENYWNKETDDKIVTMEELKEALKNGKSPGEDNLNSEFYKCAGDSFHEGPLDFLNNFHRMGEKCCCTYIQDRWQTEGGKLGGNWPTQCMV